MASVLSLAGLIDSMGSMTTTRRTREDMRIPCYAAMQSSALPMLEAGRGSLPKTVNHATVVWPSLPRNVDPIPWLARPGYVKKPQDSSTYARTAQGSPRQIHGEHAHYGQAETHGTQSSGDRRQQ